MHFSRRNLREQAFAIIFEKSVTGSEVDEIISNAIESRADCDEIIQLSVDEYPVSTAKGVYEHIDEIDGIISRFSKNRSISRLSLVVRSVLRLAVYEIIYDDSLDPPVSINEAVELAKKYAGQQEAGFVNGVLGSYVRSLGDIE